MVVALVLLGAVATASVVCAVGVTLRATGMTGGGPDAGEGGRSPTNGSSNGGGTNNARPKRTRGSLCFHFLFIHTQTSIGGATLFWRDSDRQTCGPHVGKGEGGHASAVVRTPLRAR